MDEWLNHVGILKEQIFLGGESTIHHSVTPPAAPVISYILFSIPPSVLWSICLSFSICGEIGKTELSAPPQRSKVQNNTATAYKGTERAERSGERRYNKWKKERES